MRKAKYTSLKFILVKSVSITILRSETLAFNKKLSSWLCTTMEWLSWELTMKDYSPLRIKFFIQIFRRSNCWPDNSLQKIKWKWPDIKNEKHAYLESWISWVGGRNKQRKSMETRHIYPQKKGRSHINWHLDRKVEPQQGGFQKRRYFEASCK